MIDYSYKQLLHRSGRLTRRREGAPDNRTPPGARHGRRQHTPSARVSDGLAKNLPGHPTSNAATYPYLTAAPFICGQCCLICAFYTSKKEAFVWGGGVEAASNPLFPPPIPFLLHRLVPTCDSDCLGSDLVRLVPIRSDCSSSTCSGFDPTLLRSSLTLSKLALSDLLRLGRTASNCSDCSDLLEVL